MRDLNYQLKQLCQRNRDGSYATRADRERMLTLVANQLREMGFRHLQTSSLKPKHVEALLDRWVAEGKSTGTIKNRMSVLRWWAEKINKQSVIAKRNESYGIAERIFVTNVSKAKVLDAEKLARVDDPYTAMSLRLQAAFGLRREESIKFIPSYAMAGAADVIRLKDTWTKGGRARTVPVLTEAQRTLLAEARQLAGTGSLIPATMLYKDQLQRFKSQCARAGINGVHGLRHQYAQERYEQLTGWKCPAAGGPISKQLKPAQKAYDTSARQAIAIEMGHYRIQISAVYLGR